MPDYVAMLRINGGDPFLLHVEFFDRYSGEDGPVWRKLVMAVSVSSEVGGSLFSSQGCPAKFPVAGSRRNGDTFTRHKFRTVKLWELDPGPVLATEDPSLLPWALVMRLGRDEAYRVGAKVSASREERWISRFLTLGTVRYDMTEVEEMFGGVPMRLAEALEKAILSRQKEVGREKGMAEGRAEGKAQGKADSLRKALAVLFPGLESRPEIDQIRDTDVLDSLLCDHVIRNTNRDEVLQAILRAASASKAE
jgi:hypothetical protein